MNKSQSDYENNSSMIRAEVRGLLNEGHTNEACGIPESEYERLDLQIRDIYARLPKQNFCKCLFERVLFLGHKVNQIHLREISGRLEREFPTFSEDIRVDLVIDLATLFCPCHFQDFDDRQSGSLSSIDSILFLCSSEGFDCRLALENFIMSSDDNFVSRVVQFYRELVPPQIVIQMRPIRSCLKKANKNRSSEIDKKFLKPKPNPFIKNPVKRQENQSKQQDRVVTKFMDEKRKIKYGFEPQILGLSVINDNISESVHEGIEALNKLRASLESGVHHHHHFEEKDELLAALENLKKFDHKFDIKLPSVDGSSVVKITAICGLVSALVLYKDKIFNSTTGVTAIVGAATAIIGLEFGSRLQNWLNDYEKQSFSCDTEYVSSVLFSILSLGTYTDNSWKSKFNECTKVLNMHGRVTRALSDILNFCIETIEKIMRFIYQDVCGCEYETLISCGDNVVRKWRDDVNNLSLRAKQEEFPINSINHGVILKLQREGLKLEKRFEGAGNSHKRSLVIVQGGLRVLENIQEPFLRAAFAKNKLRPKPLTVLLIGKSGVGKSAITVPLIQSVLARTLNLDELEHFRQNPMDFIYTCAFETKFWDGFYNQRVVVFDDFLQTKDGPSEPDGEAMKMIRASNLFPYLLHMAHLEDKANHYFNANLIVATTNNANLVSELLREPEALVRRFDIPVFVYPKKEFCVNPEASLNDRRLKRMKIFNFNVYEFHIKAFDAKSLTWQGDTVMDYEELVEYISARYQEQHAIGEDYLATVNNHLESEIEARLSAEQPAPTKEKSFEPQMASFSAKDLGNIEYAADLVKSGGNGYTMEIAPKSPTPGRDSKYKLEFSDDDKVLSLKHVPGVDDDTYWESVKDRVLAQAMQFYHGITKRERLKIPDWATRILGTILEWKSVLIALALSSGALYGVIKYFDEGKRTLRDVIAKFCTHSDGTVNVPTSLLEYPDGHDFTDAELQSVGLIGGKLQQMKLRAKQAPDLSMLKTFTPQVFQVCKTTEQVADKILRNNWYCLLRPDGVLVGNALALKGDIFLLNAHYFSEFSKWKLHDFQEIYFVHPSDYLTDSWREGSFVALIENLISQEPTEEENLFDSWVVRVKGMQPHKNIVHLFACESTYDLYKGSIPGVIYYLRENGEEKGVQPYLRCMTRSTKLSPILEHGDVSWADYISFPLTTVSGDCGALLFVNEDFTHGGRLIGIHAGYSHGTKLAIGVVCTRERIEKLLKRYSWSPVVPEGLPDFRDSLFSLQLRGIAPHVYYPIGVSKLRRSPCYGVLGEGNKRPAILKPCALGNPLEIALSKYGGPNRQVPQRLLQAAVNDYTSVIQEIHSKRKREILSFDEACVGRKGDPYINAIPRNTSAGYPYNTYVKNPGKWEIFGDDDEYDLTTPLCKRLREECDNIEKEMLSGKRIQHFFVDCLKDELRSDEKAKACSTRMFSACPLPLVVMIKRYFGDYCAFFLENRLKNESIVGINPFNEWDALAKIVLKQGDRCIAGDFSKFDATQYSQVLQSIVDIINNWYNDSFEHQEIRRILWCEIWNSHHINSGLWMEWVKSNPSGNPLTTILNTMYLSIVFRMCFMMKYQNAYSISQFRKLVTLFGNGDDNLLAISDKIVDEFNYFTIPDLMNQLGLVYTSEDKSVSTVPYKPLSKCEFLKRGFKFHKGKWIAPLNWDTIRQMPYWYRKGPDVPKRICDNVDCALREATMHGKDKFDLLFSKCSEVLRSVGLPQPVHDFDYYYSALALEWYEEENDSVKELYEDLDKLILESPKCEPNDIEPQCATIELVQRVSQLPPKKQGLIYSSSLLWLFFVLWLSAMLDNYKLSVHRRLFQLDTELTVQVSSYLGLLPGETINYQETGCYPWNECTEGQDISLAANEGKTVQESTEKTPGLMHSQGVLNATTTSSATMHFTEGRGSVSYAPFDIKALNSVLLKNPSTIYQDIQIFLKKPVKINTFTWSTASAAGTTLLSFKVPFDSGMSADIALFKNKLAGFMGFRATAVIKVACSVNKFAQGRLLLHFIPGIPDLVPQTQNMYLYDLTTRTQQPRVDLDIGMQTEAEIRIPFVNASLYYDLTTGVNPWAKFYITIYSALVGPASSITSSVFLSFEDAQFVIPTSVQPQSSSTRKNENVSEQETYNGPLSTRFNSISEAFKSLSQVPELSSVAGTAGWVSECLAKSARMFGFSKPSENEPAKIVANVQYSNALNFDGINTHVPLGLSARNKVDVLPGFAGNNVDELSIRYITQRAAFFRSVTWSNTDAVDTNLWIKLIAPASEVNTYTIGGNTCNTAPPISWISRIFGYVRGDIVLHLKFVKTQFHTGKLMLCYDPSPSAPATMTTSKASYVHTEVIDISEKSEFHVRLPYCRLTPWVTTSTPYATVYLVVLTPLNAPTSVSSNISILMEISGGDNLEFAGLRDYSPTPMLDTTFTPQIKEIDDMEGEDGIVAIGNAQISRDPFVCEQFCIGEKITSLKQILLRHTRMYLGNSGNIKSLQIDPFGCGGTKYNGTTTTYAPLSRDMYSCIAAGYVLARGGMNYILQNTGDNASTSTRSLRASMAITANSQHNLMYTSNTLLFDFNTGTYVTNAYVSPCLAVHVPAWGLSHSRYCVTDYDTNLRNWVEAEPRVLLSFVNPSTAATVPQIANTSLFRAIADDGGLGYFIGFPLFQGFLDWNGAPNL